MNVVDFKIADIIVTGDRLRDVRPERAESLALSISQSGLHSPIKLTPPDAEGKAKLIFGANRLTAAKLLGWEEIPSIFAASDDPLEWRLLEIDENLFRDELSMLDRGAFLAERQDVYETLFPQTKAGIAGAVGKHKNADAKLAFADATAEIMGLSARTIQRDIQRFKNIPAEIRKQIQHSPLAEKGSELDALAALEKDEQLAVVEELMSEEPRATSISKALPIIRGEKVVEKSPDEQQLEALKKQFTKSSESVQGQFMNWLKELEIV